MKTGDNVRANTLAAMPLLPTVTIDLPAFMA